MIRNAPKEAAVFGVDLGKNLFHVVGLAARALFRDIILDPKMCLSRQIKIKHIHSFWPSFINRYVH